MAARSTNLKTAMKCFMQAMQLDEKGDNQQAYIEYLGCLQYISGALYEDAKNESSPGGSKTSSLVTAESQKMMNLIQNCTERLAQLQSELATPQQHHTKNTTREDPPPYQQTDSSTLPSMHNLSEIPELPAPPTSASSTAGARPPTHAIPRVPDLPSPPTEAPGTTRVEGQARPTRPLPSPRKQAVTSPSHAAKLRRTSYDRMSPMEKAYQENRLLMEAYSARLKRMTGTKHHSAVAWSKGFYFICHVCSKVYEELVTLYNVPDEATAVRLQTCLAEPDPYWNLTFQRRLIENLEIAKERERQLAIKIKERHEHLQRLAAEKFSRGGGLSKDDVELQNTYASILEYENVNTWIQEQHERLRASPKDVQVISNLISDIIKDTDHPFSLLIRRYQEAVISKLEPLIEEKNGESAVVPLPGVTVLELCEREIIRADSFRDSKPKSVMFNDDFMARLLSFRNSERYEEMLQDVGQDIVSWEGDEMFEELIDELIESSGDLNTFYPERNTKQDDVKGQREESPETKDNMEGGCNMDSELEEETPASVMEEFKEITEQVRDDLNTAVTMGEETSNQVTDDSGLDEYSVDGDEEDVQSNEREGLERGNNDDDDGDHQSVQENDKNEQNIDKNDIVDNRGNMEVGESGDNAVAETSAESDSSSKSKPVPSPRQISGADESEEQIVKRLQAEALERHMENLAKEIKAMIEKLVSLLVAVYDELSNAVAKEQCLTIIECHFFPAIWPMLLKFFRRINHKKEHEAGIAMTRYLHALPEHIGIAPTFCLKTDERSEHSDRPLPYHNVVQELIKVSHYQCPADKLECLVRVSGSVIQCVNDFYDAQGETKHITVGCDDLLPILSFVLLKSGLPSIVSEIHAMEMFIQEGYLFGKEGYCLTTVQTALSYVFKLSEE